MLGPVGNVRPRWAVRPRQHSWTGFKEKSFCAHLRAKWFFVGKASREIEEVSREIEEASRGSSLKKIHFARTCAQNEFSLERHLVKLRRHLVKLDLRNARVQKRRAFVNRILGSWSVAPLLNSCISREAFESRHPVIILLRKHETGWSWKWQDDYPVYPVCDTSLYIYTHIFFWFFLLLLLSIYFFFA